MAARVIWRRLAEQDLTAAYFHLGHDSPAAAERLLDAVEDALELLLENPDAGTLRALRSTHVRNVRSWVVKRFPACLILYRSESESFVSSGTSVGLSKSMR